MKLGSDALTTILCARARVPVLPRAAVQLASCQQLGRVGSTPHLPYSRAHASLSPQACRRSPVRTCIQTRNCIATHYYATLSDDNAGMPLVFCPRRLQDLLPLATYLELTEQERQNEAQKQKERQQLLAKGELAAS